MATFDVDNIKLAFMNSIRTYIYPYQSSHPESVSLLESGTLTQECYLFSESISAYGIYVSATIGTPTGLTIRLMNGNSTVNSSTVPGTVGWNIVTYSEIDLVSSRLSSLVVTGGVSGGNDYFIGKDTVSKYFFNNSSATMSLAFTIGVKDFVYKVYPLEEIDHNRIPVVVVDVAGRPRIDDRYLSGDFSWFDITMRADIYAKHTQELEKIAYGCDRGVFRNRKDFAGIYFITPGAMSQISYAKPEVYTRSINWTLKQLIARE